MASDLVVHRGGCHCGNIRFEVTAPAEITVSECNCSICSKSGYLGLTVRADRFRLVTEPAGVTAYRFNTGRAKHVFCAVCGIKSYYHPRSHADGINVNARCLEPGTVTAMTVRKVDGRNWETVYADAAPSPYLNC